jgi:large subunit ribosomal protein L35
MKQKTHSGAKKRFKVTGSGRIQKGKAARKHLLSSKNIRYGEYNSDVSPGHKKTVKKLLVR